MALFKQPYLNEPFFLARASFYFLVWSAIALWVRRQSRLQDAAADPAAAARLSRWRGALLIPLAITTTFAAFDWLMSLAPEWFSSAFGVYYAAGSFRGGLALLTILAPRARRTALAEELSRYHFHALGRLLLALVVFWAYIAFFQAMLIRIADRPEEVTFYLHRLTGSWQWLTYALILGHFVLPFFLLRLTYLISYTHQHAYYT